MFRLLAAQKSMYYFEKLNPNTTTYHHTIAINIAGNLDEKLFMTAIEQLIKRHEVLRSSIVENSDEIYLKPASYNEELYLANQLVVKINAEEKMRIDAETIQDTLKNLKKENIIEEPFNFKTGPLWRGALVTFNENEHQFFLVLHHLITDIWSQNVILSDLSEMYNALVQKRTPTLEPIISLSTLRMKPEADSDQDKLIYWKDKLENLTAITLHPDFLPRDAFRFNGDRIYFHIDSDIINSFNKSAEQYKSSLSSFLLATIYTLLYRYTGETDICLGIASANRRGYVQDTDNLVNCFINSIPLRLMINNKGNFLSLLDDVTTSLKSALSNQIPLDAIIQKALTTETKTASHVTSPFNILCNFNKEKNDLNLTGLATSSPVELNLGHSKFENFGINFDMLPDESCNGFLEFNTDRFKRSTMELFIEHLQIVWRTLAQNSNYIISHIPILTETENDLLNKRNENKKITPANDFFQNIFNRVAQNNTQKTAVVFHGENNKRTEITFGELDLLSTQLAAYLQNIGIGPEVTVGVCLNRSINLIVAILAILKAGGVVVTLETSINTQQLFKSSLYHKISDTLIDTVIVDNQTENLFAAYRYLNKSFFTLNIQRQEYLTQVKQLNLNLYTPKLLPQNLAYIMYTSGSTSVPKGVMIEHESLTNLAYAISDRNLKQGSNILCTAPPTFDCFFFEMLEWLSVSGVIHLINEKERLKPSKQIQIIRDFDINCATLLPDIIKNLDPNMLPSLNDVISMGSNPAKNTLDLWRRAGKVIRNEYGPTEATICSTENHYIDGMSYTNIGKPIRNVDMFVLDKDFRECPLGVPGNLYIGGAGLARGYVGNETLTQEKFVTLYFNPNNHSFSEFNAENNNSQFVSNKSKKHPLIKKRKLNEEPIERMRLYATGDLARYILDPNGNLSFDFLGRTDRQIKIHGVRIEIDGVEVLLQKHTTIKDIFVKPNEEKNALIAYVVTKANQKMMKSDMDSYLGQTSLPMVAWPKAVIQIKEMPITKNGKIDIKALPEPSNVALTLPVPQTSLQKQLCEIWSEILGTNQIDINKTFREHGGDSVSFATLETKIIRKMPILAKTDFNILNRDITIIELETKLKSYLQVKRTSTAPKCWTLSNTRVTLFFPNKARSLAFQPLRQPILPKSKGQH